MITFKCIFPINITISLLFNISGADKKIKNKEKKIPYDLARKADVASQLKDKSRCTCKRSYIPHLV